MYGSNIGLLSELSFSHAAYCLEWMQDPPNSDRWVRCGQLFNMRSHGCEEAKPTHFLRDAKVNSLYIYWKSHNAQDLGECTGFLVNRQRPVLEPIQEEEENETVQRLERGIEESKMENDRRFAAGENDFIDMIPLYNELNRLRPKIAKERYRSSL
jgi:hypothetical protein